MKNLLGNQQQQTQTAGQAGEHSTDPSGVNPNGVNQEGEGEEGNEEDQPIYTQAQVDAIVAKRVKREQRKFAKQQQTSQQTVNQNTQQVNPAGGDPTSDVSSIVAEVLKHLNVGQPQQQETRATTVQSQTSESSDYVKRLAKLTAKTEALALGVDPEYVDDVLLLARIDRLDLDPEGDFDATDEQKIQNALKGVLKKHQHFSKKTQQTTPPVKAGFGSRSQGGNQTLKPTGLRGALQDALMNGGGQ